MANQVGVLFGKGAMGTDYKLPVTIIDTTQTLATFTTYGAATQVTFPEEVVFYDLQIVAAVATITQVAPVVDGDQKRKASVLAASIANQTTTPQTRFGAPWRVRKGSTFSMVSIT